MKNIVKGVLALVAGVCLAVGAGAGTSFAAAMVHSHGKVQQHESSASRPSEQNRTLNHHPRRPHHRSAGGNGQLNCLGTHGFSAFCAKGNHVCDGDNDYDDSGCTNPNVNCLGTEGFSSICARNDRVCDGDNDSDDTACGQPRLNCLGTEGFSSFCARNDRVCDGDNDSDDSACANPNVNCLGTQGFSSRCARGTHVCDGDNDYDDLDCPLAVGASHTRPAALQPLRQRPLSR